MKNAGYSLRDMHANGYFTLAQLGAAGFSKRDMTKYGFNEGQLAQAGFLDVSDVSDEAEGTGTSASTSAGGAGAGGADIDPN